mgnify:FL=1
MTLSGNRRIIEIAGKSNIHLLLIIFAGNGIFMKGREIHMSCGKLRLPCLISDGMVLQRDREFKIWGWAGAGDRVTVKLIPGIQENTVAGGTAAGPAEETGRNSIDACTDGMMSDGAAVGSASGECTGQVHECTAGADGRWEVLLQPVKAGGPYTLVVSAVNNTGKSRGGADIEAKACAGMNPCAETGAGNASETAQQITVKDILAGDVWLCSGQSNMQTPVIRLVDKFGKEITGACSSMIRYFNVPERYDFKKKHDELEGGSWIRCDAPDKVMLFSAVALFFAAELHKKYDIPVGIINASVGGSPIEAWMSEDSLADWPDSLEELARCKDDAYVDGTKRRDEAAVTQWLRQLDMLDEGLGSNGEPLYSGEIDISGWDDVNIPTSWEDAGLRNFYGSIWLRKTFTLPAGAAGKEAVLRLGTIIDSDVAYVNGVQVGAVPYRYPPRKYMIPPGLTKEGENTITVRVISNSGDGGFVEDKPYTIEADGEVIDLAGRWKYRIGARMENPMPEITFFNWKPAGLYNGMIAPLHDFVIRGVAWYQGEANTFVPGRYSGLFRKMVRDWRKAWGNDNLPFLYVQLHNWQRPASEPGDSQWARLREQQLKALSLPGAGMASAIDAGEWNDIHPLDKITVAKRLALAAYRIAYGEDIIASGPIYKDMVKEGNRIRIRFMEPTGGLVSVGGEPLRHFAVAGPDRRFVWAEAKIEGDTVVVWNDGIDDPVAVRYAWADNPEGANLYNRAGLPASPFRTDDWD